MSRELHHRKKDDKYALYSTIIDDYITGWEDKETIRDMWLGNMVRNSIEKVNTYMEQIDKEVLGDEK